MTITPYIGYRDGGDFQDAVTGTRLYVDESESFGLILGWDVFGGQLEVSYSHQASEFSGRDKASAGALVDIDVSNLLFAGKSILDAESGGYVSVLLGLTYIDIDSGALDSDIRPALGFGGGFEPRIGDDLKWRVGLRGIVTFLDDNDDELCKSSSDCPILIDDESFVQWELFTGLGFKF